MCADIVCFKIPYNVDKQNWRNHIVPNVTMYEVIFMEYKIFFAKTREGWTGTVWESSPHAKRSLNISGLPRGESQKWEIFGDLIPFIQEFIDEITDVLTVDYHNDDSDD